MLIEARHAVFIMPIERSTIQWNVYDIWHSVATNCALATQNVLTLSPFKERASHLNYMK